MVTRGPNSAHKPAESESLTPAQDLYSASGHCFPPIPKPGQTRLHVCLGPEGT